MNIELLLKTGLTQAELATLFGVHRTTIISWLRGRFSPHKLHRDQIRDTARRIESAVSAGHLPLPAGIGKPARLKEARKAIGLTD